MSLLRIKDLNIVYYTLSGPVRAVVDASLEIEPG